MAPVSPFLIQNQYKSIGQNPPEEKAGENVGNNVNRPWYTLNKTAMVDNIPIGVRNSNGQSGSGHIQQNQMVTQHQQAQQYAQAQSVIGRDQQSSQLQGQSGGQLQNVLPCVPSLPPLDPTSNDDKRCVQYESEVRGHSGAVYCSDISADNRYIATGSFDKTIIIWDVNFPYKMRCCLNGHTQLVSDLCWALTGPVTIGKDEDDDDDDDEDDEGKGGRGCKYLLYSVSFDKTVCCACEFNFEYSLLTIFNILL